MYKLFEEDTGYVWTYRNEEGLLNSFRNRGWYCADVDNDADELREHLYGLFYKGFFLVKYDAFKRLTFWDNKDFTWRDIEIRSFNMLPKLNDFLKEEIGT